MVVSGDQGSVAISELFPGVSYDVVVVPFNTEPSGQELAGSPSSAVAPSKIAWCAFNCRYYFSACICIGIASSVIACSIN